MKKLYNKLNKDLVEVLNLDLVYKPLDIDYIIKGMINLINAINGNIRNSKGYLNYTMYVVF